jgi:hypothetical protein
MMTKDIFLKIITSIIIGLCSLSAQSEGDVDAIEKARQAKEAADKAAAEAAAATEAAIEAAAAKAAKEARQEAKRKKEEDEARRLAEAAAAEEAELDAAAQAAAREAKRKMAAELGLEVDDLSEDQVADAVVDTTSEDSVVVSENLGFNLGVTGSLGFVNGAYISNNPVGASLVISTPWGFTAGPLELGVSFALGSYSGESNEGQNKFNPFAAGLGLNAVLGDLVFSETHVGSIGAGTGVRNFSGVSLERLMQGKTLNLPFNVLIGGEGFISSKPEEGEDVEASYWGGLGIRIDYSF